MKNNVFKCSDCGLVLKDEIAICLHMHTNRCRKKINKKNSNQNVAKILRYYICPHCEFRSKNFSTVHYHRLHTHKNVDNHMKEEPALKVKAFYMCEVQKLAYECRECSIYFSCKNTYRRHIQEIHPDVFLLPTINRPSKNKIQKKVVYRCEHCFTCYKNRMDCVYHIDINHDWKNIFETENKYLANSSSDDSDDDIDKNNVIIETLHV